MRAALIFLAPATIALCAVAGWPLARTIAFSFTDARLGHLQGAHWVGLRNYFAAIRLDSGRIIHGGVLADPGWWRAVANTLGFAVVSVTIESVLGMAIALALNAKFRGRGLMRAAILIPWAIPTIVSARMWSWMLNDQFGIVNDALLRLGVIGHKIAWTVNPDTAMIAVVGVDVWKTTPFMALLILAGLQTIPDDIYEAAAIDGVSPIATFFKITLPLVRPALLVAMIFRFLDSMRMFDLVYVLTPNSAQTNDDVGHSRGRTCSTSTSSPTVAARRRLLFLIIIRRRDPLYPDRSAQSGVTTAHETARAQSERDSSTSSWRRSPSSRSFPSTMRSSPA